MASPRIKFVLIWISSIAITLMFAKYYWSGCSTDKSMYKKETVVHASSSQNNSTTEVNVEQYQGKRETRSRNIFYNRVGKCGSRSLLQVVARLKNRNKFFFQSSSDTGNLHPDIYELQREVTKIARFPTPTLYNRHIHFIDFSKFGYQKPIYINMIRNPMDRFVSQYNYLKYGDNAQSKRNLTPDRIDINECVEKEVDLCNDTMFTFYTGMHFCGMHPTCKVKSMKRVYLAKKHLEEEYAFVGMMEEFETTLLLLEKMLPEYFTGALQVWTENQSFKIKTATKKMDVLTEESIHKLQTKILPDEFEVYNFAKQKFDRLKEKFELQTKFNS